MAAVVADTHAAVWHLLGSSRLSEAAREAIEAAANAGDPVYLSAVSLVEVIYLVEKGRLPRTALDDLLRKLEEPDALFSVTPVDLGVARALLDIPRDAVPDMPDRIIGATAKHLGVALVTRDERLRAAVEVDTIW